MVHAVGGDRLEPVGQEDVGPGAVRVLEPDLAHGSAAVGAEPLGAFPVRHRCPRVGRPTGRWRESTDDWLHRSLGDLDTARPL